MLTHSTFTGEEDERGMSFKMAYSSSDSSPLELKGIRGMQQQRGCVLSSSSPGKAECHPTGDIFRSREFACHHEFCCRAKGDRGIPSLMC